MKTTTTLNALLATSVLALGACASFPPEAQPIAAKALQERLAGKTYTTRLASGVSWESVYGADGRMSMKVSNGTADKGQWRTEDGRLCIDFEGSFPSGCSEVQADAKQLYLKRASTGEIVALTPKP